MGSPFRPPGRRQRRASARWGARAGVLLR